jgi:hypothetical protein
MRVHDIYVLIFIAVNTKGLLTIIEHKHSRFFTCEVSMEVVLHSSSGECSIHIQTRDRLTLPGVVASVFEYLEVKVAGESVEVAEVDLPIQRFEPVVSLSCLCWKVLGDAFQLGWWVNLENVTVHGLNNAVTAAPILVRNAISTI